MEPTSSKKQIIMGVVAVLILAAIILVSMAHKTQAPAEDTGGNTNATSTVSEVSSTTATTTATSTKPVTKPALTYTQAVNLYANKRMQFDASCGVSPLQLIVKNKTTIMLDNRASQARTVYLDRAAYNLGALGSKTVTLSYATASLPHTITVDCGTGRNNAKIIVQ